MTIGITIKILRRLHGAARDVKTRSLLSVRVFCFNALGDGWGDREISRDFEMSKYMHNVVFFYKLILEL